MSTLEDLLSKILSNELLVESMFHGVDYDQILDLRDSEEFEKEWLANFDEVINHYEEKSYAESITDFIDEIRETVFKVTNQHTGGHEIASYLSDDFEMICKGILLEKKNKYAMTMLEKYMSGNLI